MVNNRKLPKALVTTLTRASWVELLIETPDFKFYNASQLEVICSTVFQWMSEQLNAGRGFYFKKLGHLSVQHKKARPGRNPKSGEPFTVSARRITKFNSRSSDVSSPIHRGEWISKIREDRLFAAISVKQAGALYDTFLSLLERVHCGECRIEIRGFGVFSPSVLPPRQTLNPKTGERLHSEEKRRIIFKDSRQLHTLLNK